MKHGMWVNAFTDVEELSEALAFLQEKAREVDPTAIVSIHCNETFTARGNAWLEYEDDACGARHYSITITKHYADGPDEDEMKVLDRAWAAIIKLEKDECKGEA